MTLTISFARALKNNFCVMELEEQTANLDNDKDKSFVKKIAKVLCIACTIPHDYIFTH